MACTEGREPSGEAMVHFSRVLGDARRSPLRALTTGLRWSNREGHEDRIRRSAETDERLCARG